MRKRFKIFQRESAFFANAPEQHFQQLVSVQDAFIDQLDVEIVFRVRDGFDRHLLFEGKLKQVCRKCAWRRFVVCQDNFGKFRRILREIIRVLKIGHGNFLLDRVLEHVNEPQEDAQDDRSEPDKANQTIGTLFLFALLNRLFKFFIFNCFNMFF